MNKEETEKEQTKIETAINNILRGMDIESAALILEKVILDNYIITKGRVNILHLAVRQILYFIENSKIQNVGDKNILDYVKENVKLKEQIKELGQKESILDKVTDKLKEDAREEEGYIKWLDERTQEISQPKKTIIVKSDYARSILNIIEGEKK